MTTPPTDVPERRARRTLRALARPTVALPTAVGVVFFVAGLVHLTRTWHPYGDWAVAELVIRHTERYLPLSGPYSAQRGYNHPLPLVYAIQWLPYEVFGERSSAGLATTIWWNGAWLAGLVWMLARARAVWLGVLAVVTVPIMAGNTPSGSLILPWNPSLALIPGVVLVFVAWRVALGSHRQLPVMVALATWCTGAHLGFAPFAISVSAAGVLGLVVATLRAGGTAGLRRLGRPVALATLTALALTAPLLFDLARNGDDSNPVHIVERGRPEPGTDTVPVEELLKVFRAELAIPPAWATTNPPYNAYYFVRPAQLPVALFAGVAVAIAAWRRGAGDELVGPAIALVGLAAASAGLANIQLGTLQPWYLLSAHAASMAYWAFVVWSAGRSLRALVRGRTGRAPATRAGSSAIGAGRAVAAPAAVLVAALLVVPSLHIQPHSPAIERPTAELFAAIEDRFAPGAAIELVGPIDFDGYITQALALELDRAGFDVRVPDDQLYLFTPALEAPARWQGTRLEIQIGTIGTPPIDDPRWQLVATTSITHPIIVEAEFVSVWEVDPGR